MSDSAQLDNELLGLAVCLLLSMLLFLIQREVSIGVRVSAANNEQSNAKLNTIASSLKITLAIPSVNTSGKKIARVVRVLAIIAALT